MHAETCVLHAHEYEYKYEYEYEYMVLLSIRRGGAHRTLSTASLGGSARGRVV